MNEEQNWITNIETVASRIARPSIPAHVLERIHGIPASLQRGMDKVSRRTIWLAAASIALLIAVNLYFVANANQTTASEDSLGETYFPHINQVL